MVLQEAGDFDSVFVMSLHPEVECLGAPIGEEAVEGRRDGPGRELNELDALGQRRVFHRNRAHQDVGVTVHVLGARVKRNVGA